MYNTDCTTADVTYHVERGLQVICLSYCICCRSYFCSKQRWLRWLL